MPSKKRAGSVSKANNDGNWRAKLLTIDFTYEEQAEFRSWEKTVEIDVPSKFEEYVDDGFKMSQCWSEYFDCYYISATDKTAGTCIEGKTVSVRHADYDTAMLLMVYVIEVWVANGHAQLVEGNLGFGW